jgi:hypothetical protein
MGIITVSAAMTLFVARKTIHLLKTQPFVKFEIVLHHFELFELFRVIHNKLKKLSSTNAVQSARLFANHISLQVQTRKKGIRTKHLVR